MGLKDLIKGFTPSGVAGNTAKEIFSQGVELIDSVHTSEEERMNAKKDLLKTATDQLMRQQEAATNRHASDMQSDNKLSKSVRPMSLIYLIVIFTIISMLDGNVSSFIIKEAYIKTYEGLLDLAFAFYFGGRTVEKGMKMVQDYKTKRELRKEKKQDN